MAEGQGSLARRLVLAALVFGILALVGAGLAINGTLHRFVIDQIDRRLDAQLIALAAALDVDAEGAVALSREIDVPPFDQPLSGWYWQVLGADAPERSASLAGADIGAVAGVAGPQPSTAAGTGPRGETLHLRLRQVTLGGAGRPLTLIAAAPPAGVQAPLTEARTTLFLTLAILGVALAAAVLLQVRLGLLPLRRLQGALAAVTAGRTRRIPADQPSEIEPLVRELNGLLERNEETLARARAQASNLAHGLKTPLATLTAALRVPGRDPDGELARLAALMDRRVTHHLRRARSAALGGRTHRRTELAPHVADLLDVLPRIHADRGIVARAEVDGAITLACDPEDLDEMLGNLLDNAFKWAAREVTVSAEVRLGRATVRVEDDGPGLRPEERDRVLQPGERLDEQVPGDGFGLPITRELASLYGGGLTLGQSSSGGLAAILVLPLAPAG